MITLPNSNVVNVTRMYATYFGMRCQAGFLMNEKSIDNGLLWCNIDGTYTDLQCNGKKKYSQNTPLFLILIL